MHITTSKTLSFIFAPLIKLTKYMGVHHPVTLIRIRYFARFGKFPNLKNPKDLNEKILYLKLFSDTSMWTDIADKYKVRDYVKKCGLEDTLVKLYGVWYDAESFNLEELPNSFILKANNGFGSNLIIKNKNGWNNKRIREIINLWLNEKNIGSLAAEPQYENITPCVIAEELLPIEEVSTSLIDYKIWCFNGKAHNILTCSSRTPKSVCLGCYDLEWNYYPENLKSSKDHPLESEPLLKPINLDKMIMIAEKLSKPFPQVRVDLYNINGKIYFGELTFTSLGGMMNYYTPEFLLEMGNKVDINYKL
ncbi:MAG: ATP-grasp fold amidoligase family protein [Bacteroidales bacterium]|jgi:hypothetical protein